MMIDAHVHLPEDPSQLLKQAASVGIDQLVFSALADWSQFPDSGAISAANRRAAEFAAASQGRAAFLAYLNPQNQDWPEELERALAAGAIGIKLWISLKDSAGAMTNTLRVLQRAETDELPVVVHVFNRTGGNLPGEINLAEFVELSQQVPKCVMVAAHLGGNWRASIGLFRLASPQAYCDLSGFNPENGVLEEWLREIGSDRILFGSDGPGRSFASQLEKVHAAKITPEQREQILWQNARRVFRLPSVEPIKPEPQSPLPLPDQSEEHFVFTGRWPFDERNGGTPAELEKKLAAAKIERAFTVSFDAIFRQDHAVANRTFRTACKNLQRIHPLAAIDPNASDALAFDAAEFAGVWCSPYLHHWQVDAPQYRNFFEQAALRRQPVWLNCGIDEYRFRASGFEPRPVGSAELNAFMKTAPANQYVIQGWSDWDGLEPQAGFKFELSRLTDRQTGLRSWIKQHGCTQLVWGSEYPLRELDEVRKVAFFL